MKKKLLLVLLSIALCVTLFATTCGAYFVDYGGNGVPQFYYPSIEIISHIGTTPIDQYGDLYLPSQTASFGSNVFTPVTGYYGETDTYIDFYDDNYLEFNYYAFVADGDVAPVFKAEIYNTGYMNDRYLSATHSSAFFKTFGFSGKLNPETMVPEFMPGYEFEVNYDLSRNAETPLDNIATRFRVTFTLLTYKELTLASGFKQDQLEEKEITFDYYETIGPNDYVARLLIDDSLLDDYYDDFFDDASSVNGDYLFYCSGLNVRVDVVYDDTHELLPLIEKPQLQGTYFSDYTMFHDGNDAIKPLQYSLLTTLPPKNQPVLEDRTLFDFVTDTIETVMNIEILETKVGDIVGIGVAISVLLIILKVFAGG